MDVLDIFNFFSARGGRRGSPRRRAGWEDRFFIENPRRAEGPGGCLRRIGEFFGGGAKYFFCRGRNVHQANTGNTGRTVLGHRPKGLHQCKDQRLSRTRSTKIALALCTFGHLGCFDTCTRAAESQNRINQ